MDNLIDGAQTIEEAIQLSQELSELLMKGGLLTVRDYHRTRSRTQSSIKFDENETIKALGISWELESDNLRFDYKIHHHEVAASKKSSNFSIRWVQFRRLLSEESC